MNTTLVQAHFKGRKRKAGKRAICLYEPNLPPDSDFINTKMGSEQMLAFAYSVKRAHLKQGERYGPMRRSFKNVSTL